MQCGQCSTVSAVQSVRAVQYYLNARYTALNPGSGASQATTRVTIYGTRFWNSSNAWVAVVLPSESVNDVTWAKLNYMSNRSAVSVMVTRTLVFLGTTANAEWLRPLKLMVT